MTPITLDDLVPSCNASVLGTLDRASLRKHISSVALQIADCGGGEWLLYEPDPFWFIVYLYGVLLGGGNVTLLPDIRTGTLSSLNKSYAGRLGIPDDDLPRADVVQNIDGGSLPSISIGQITVLTSGSTGDRKHLTRSVEQLLSECKGLQKKWPHNEDLISASMVSHQHVYGLIFGIVWPLAQSAQVLSTQQSPVPDFATLDNNNGHAIRLITSPSYLHRIDSSIQLANYRDMHQRITKIDSVFSAGAPLDPEKAVLAAEILHCPVNEIYGSSETGAVATRRVDVQGAWQALPNVILKIKQGCLSIKAAYVAQGLQNPYISSDKVEVVGDSFILLGRTDRVVKVEGKRVSLQQIENAVENIDWIKQCAAILLIESRSQIAIAIVLHKAGLQMLHQQGKKALDKLVRQWLVKDLEPIMMPKRIRYLTTIPENSMGKITHERLRAPFAHRARFQPTLHGETRNQSSVELNLALDPDLLVFEGHFPDRPILPGVALVNWVVQLCQQYFDISLSPDRLVSIKFMSVLAPNDRLQLVLVYNEGHLDFRCLCSGEVFSKGRIKFGD